MKTYLPDETKEQRKARKAVVKSPVTNTQPSDRKKYVACLKFGKKYGPEYVNTLYRMVDRNLTLDQDWIRNQIKTGYEYWPEEWIQSYKWEMRNRPQMTRGKNGKRNFAAPGEPDIKPNTSVAVFHGDPNPHNCKDPWVIDNWK